MDNPISEAAELPNLHYTTSHRPGIKMALCQAKIPEPLYKAARAQIAADGLSWRQVIRWALVHYLEARNPPRAAKIWSKCV